MALTYFISVSTFSICSLHPDIVAHLLSDHGAIVLAECLADNKVMVRLDLRDNVQIGSAGLLALHLAMKMNTSITLLNLDTSVKEYQEQFKVYYEEIKMFCERNKQIALKKLSVQTTVQESSVANTEVSGDEKKEETRNVELEKETENTEEEESEQKEFVGIEAASKKSTVWMLSRSTSLTCSETVDDIP
ncbi:unnamed protein product, partial [Gongylonema pulchrum]|uniref:ANK_REP_REGION domain-containing protein n=1 Tax=Gongylonema pulchrum TaxID=637853 RepID=A0A183EHU9_9BILA